MSGLPTIAVFQQRAGSGPPRVVPWTGEYMSTSRLVPAVARVRQEERQSLWRLSSVPGCGEGAPELFDREEEEERDKDQVCSRFAAHCSLVPSCWVVCSNV